jgi:hypothetical protein
VRRVLPRHALPADLVRQRREHADARREGRRVTGQGTIEHLLAGQTGLEIFLPSCAVEVRVVDDLGRAVTDFGLEWTPLAASGSSNVGGGARRLRTESGTLHETLTPGTWRCSVTPSRNFAGTSREIVVPMAGPLTVIVARTGVVRGTVVDPTGKPVSGATILSSREGGVGKSKRDGSFNVRLEPGASVSLVAEAKSFAPSAPLEIELGSGEERNEVVLQLDSLAHLTGEVSGPGGRPIAGCEVSILRQDGPMYTVVSGSRCKTESSGRFTLYVPPGHFEVGIDVADTSSARSDSRSHCTGGASVR